MQLQLTRKILVLEREQPFQLCYNATLPSLFTSCDPSQNMYCNMKSPDFGCTKVVEDACTKYHFCNTPEIVFWLVGVFTSLLLILLSTGCLWCCCCCCWGRCFRRTCPCFNKLHTPSDNVVHPMVVNPTTAASSASHPPPNWNMYAGLENVAKYTPSKKYPNLEPLKREPSPSPSAPPYSYTN